MFHDISYYSYKSWYCCQVNWRFCVYNVRQVIPRLVAEVKNLYNEFAWLSPDLSSLSLLFKTQCVALNRPSEVSPSHRSFNHPPISSCPTTLPVLANTDSSILFLYCFYRCLPRFLNYVEANLLVTAILRFRSIWLNGTCLFTLTFYNLVLLRKGMGILLDLVN